MTGEDRFDGVVKSSHVSFSVFPTSGQHWSVHLEYAGGQEWFKAITERE